MKKNEKKIRNVVASVVNMATEETTREDVCRVATRILAGKGINCARDDTKYHDWLVDALDEMCG